MTTLTTPREIRSPQNGRVPKVDSPAVRARARVRVPVTQSAHKALGRVSSAVSRWWGFTARPLSLKAMWRLSTIDPKRIPNQSTALRLLWLVSNWTDRLVLLALIMLLPTAATGPLRWTAVRPTRRYGLYLTLAALTAAYLIGRN